MALYQQIITVNIVRRAIDWVMTIDIVKMALCRIVTVITTIMAFYHNKYCIFYQPRSYGFKNGTGCISCHCNSIGSSSLQCDDNGTCSCLGRSSGEKCDQCDIGYWGLPSQQCTGWVKVY